MGPYRDFEHCLRSVMAKKKWKKERAEKYCGLIYWRTEGKRKRKRKKTKRS